MSIKKKLLACSAGVAFMATAMPAVAIAQSGSVIPDVIIVTATKRESTVQDLPFSINAQTEADIRRTGADSIEDLARNVAGLTIQNLGPGQSQVAIRGVSAGQIVRDQPGVKEQVGVYLDESVISLSLFTPDLDLFDLNRVETLRGPQGTLFGSGSIGGTIRYITNQPDFGGFEASAEAELNSISDGGMGGHVKGMVNMPMGEGAALRVAAYSTEYGGFIDALGEGGSLSEDVNSGNRSGIRAALSFELADNVMITPRVVYQEVGADGFNRQEVFNVFANPHTTTRPAIQLGERQQYLLRSEEFSDEFLLFDLTAEIEFDGFDLTSVTSVTDRSILVSRDASALTGSVSVDLGYTAADVLLPSNLRDTTEIDMFTQELRLTSNSDGDVQWIVGAFFSETDRIYAQRLPTPGYDAATDLALGAGTSAAVANGFGVDSPFNSDLPYTIEQTAIFGEVNWQASDRLEITAGGRWYDFSETRTVLSGGLFAAGGPLQENTTESSGFTPRVMASYELNDIFTLNAQASQGFRLGGVNDPLNTALCTAGDLAVFGGFQDYDDETLWNYEAGIKASTGRTTFNAAVFHTQIDGLQVTLDAGSCSSRISFNVPEAHTTGVEFEFSTEIADGFYLNLSGSALEAEFDSTVLDGTGAILGGVQEGNRLASVPNVQFSASILWVYDTPWAGPNSEGFTTFAVQHVGDRITQPSDQLIGSGTFQSGLPFGGATGAEFNVVDLELDPYQLAYFSTGIDYGDMQITFFMDNVFDENVNLSFDRERGGRARLGFRTNQPRTFGINFRKQY